MTKKKGCSTTQRGWSKFVRRPEPDLPANLNTKRLKPGDPDYPCEHKVMVVKDHAQQVCLSCGYAIAIE